MSTPFPLPVLFTAWTWKDGAGIAGEVIRRAQLLGAKTVAVQLSQEGADPGSTLDETDVDYLHGAGLTVVGWDPAGTGTAPELAALKLDGWLPQVESSDQETALLGAIARGVGSGLPHAIVTTYGGLDDTAAVQRLRQVWPDLFAFVECYAAIDSIHANVSRMLSQGQVYGFDPTRLRALIGTYQGETPASYTGLTPSNFGGIYVEEETTDDQFKAFAEFAVSTPPPPAPAPVDPAACNTQIDQIAHTWLDQQTSPKPLARLACIARIAETTDTEWVAVRADVKLALDGGVTQLHDDLQKAQADNTTLQSNLAAATAQIATLTAEVNALNAKVAQAEKDLAA